MSEKELREYIAKSRQRNKMLDGDSALEAIAKVAELARKENIDWALVGGVAMAMYDSPRLTKDVDIIASKELSLTSNHQLTFGGNSFNLQVGKYDVQIDWIVRKDGFQKYYRAALQEAINLPNGLRVITPEWLVILKFKAGRQKDLDDIVFLLKQPKTVDRSIVKQKVVEIGSDDAWQMMMAGFRRLCDLADGKTTEPGKYYDEE